MKAPVYSTSFRNGDTVAQSDTMHKPQECQTPSTTPRHNTIGHQPRLQRRCHHTRRRRHRALGSRLEGAMLATKIADGARGSHHLTTRIVDEMRRGADGAHCNDRDKSCRRLRRKASSRYDKNSVSCVDESATREKLRPEGYQPAIGDSSAGGRRRLGDSPLHPPRLREEVERRTVGACFRAKGKSTKEDDRESCQRQREHPEPAKEDGAPETGSCVREGDV